MDKYARGEKTNYNYHKVLRSIWLHHEISRNELCDLLNLDKATISTIVNSLMEHSIVSEIPKSNAVTKPGRRPVGLSINPKFGCIVGIELHIDRIDCVVTDMLHRQLVTRSVYARVDSKSIAGQINTMIEEIREIPALKDYPILGVGVSVPGVVNQEAGIIYHAAELGIWNEPFNFKIEVEDRIDLPCMLSNDANACATGVLSSHRREEYENFLFLYISLESRKDENVHAIDHVSAGLGIVLNGALYDGPDGTAGEFLSINHYPEKAGQFSLSSEEISAFMNDREIRRKFIKELSSHVSLVINVFNFKHLFIGGDLEPLNDIISDEMHAAINTNWPYDTEVDCEINVLKGGTYLPSKGAAGMLLDRFFTVPGFGEDDKRNLWKNFLRQQKLGNSN